MKIVTHDLNDLKQIIFYWSVDKANGVIESLDPENVYLDPTYSSRVQI